MPFLLTANRAVIFIQMRLHQKIGHQDQRDNNRDDCIFGKIHEAFIKGQICFCVFVEFI